MDFDQLAQIKDEILQIQKTYEIFNEDVRLTHSPAAQVEFLTTVRAIERDLPPLARILDVGAGTGVYSLHFARKGHQVSAVELSPANIQAFRAHLTPGDSIDLHQGNAVDLSIFPDSAFDAVLLLGPLYHLHKEEDCQQAIAEARRVCKPGGRIYAAFIGNDFVPLTELSYNADYFASGDYDQDTFRLNDFPFVFHTVDGCRAMLKKAGLTIERAIAADGVSELLADRINAMDEANYQQYLKWHFYICEKPEFLGMTNHLLFVCR